MPDETKGNLMPDLGKFYDLGVPASPRMDFPSDQQLAEWLELAEKASPGPWTAEHEPADQYETCAHVENEAGFSLFDSRNRDYRVSLIEQRLDDGKYLDIAGMKDLALAAAARDGWPATMRALQGARSELEQTLAQVQKNNAEIVAVEDAITDVLGNADWDSAPAAIQALGEKIKVLETEAKP